MARLSKDQYLVLFVDESKEDCLYVKLAISHTARLNFLGNICNHTDIVTSVKGPGDTGDTGVKVPWADLLLMDFLMPRRRGVEVLEWLQSQPFRDLVVVLLPVTAEPEEFTTAYRFYTEGDAEGAESVPGTADLLEFLQQYAASRSGGGQGK
jgi:CheY-like chemotaxis protein